MGRSHEVKWTEMHIMVSQKPGSTHQGGGANYMTGCQETRISMIFPLTMKLFGIFLSDLNVFCKQE